MLFLLAAQSRPFPKGVSVAKTLIIRQILDCACSPEIRPKMDHAKAIANSQLPHISPFSRLEGGWVKPVLGWWRPQSTLDGHYVEEQDTSICPYPNILVRPNYSFGPCEGGGYWC